MKILIYSIYSVMTSYSIRLLVELFEATYTFIRVYINSNQEIVFDAKIYFSKKTIFSSFYKANIMHMFLYDLMTHGVNEIIWMISILYFRDRYGISLTGIRACMMIIMALNSTGFHSTAVDVRVSAELHRCHCSTCMWLLIRIRILIQA